MSGDRHSSRAAYTQTVCSAAAVASASVRCHAQGVDTTRRVVSPTPDVASHAPEKWGALWRCQSHTRWCRHCASDEAPAPMPRHDAGSGVCARRRNPQPAHLTAVM